MIKGVACASRLLLSGRPGHRICGNDKTNHAGEGGNPVADLAMGLERSAARPALVLRLRPVRNKARHGNERPSHAESICDANLPTDVRRTSYAAHRVSAPCVPDGCTRTFRRNPRKSGSARWRAAPAACSARPAADAIWRSRRWTAQSPGGVRRVCGSDRFGVLRRLTSRVGIAGGRAASRLKVKSQDCHPASNAPALRPSLPLSSASGLGNAPHGRR